MLATITMDFFTNLKNQMLYHSDSGNPNEWIYRFSRDYDYSELGIILGDISNICSTLNEIHIPSGFVSGYTPLEDFFEDVMMSLLSSYGVFVYNESLNSYEIGVVNNIDVIINMARGISQLEFKQYYDQYYKPMKNTTKAIYLNDKERSEILELIKLVLDNNSDYCLMECISVCNEELLKQIQLRLTV